jgi:hypothetical protein
MRSGAPVGQAIHLDPQPLLIGLFPLVSHPFAERAAVAGAEEDGPLAGWGIRDVLSEPIGGIVAVGYWELTIPPEPESTVQADMDLDALL